MATMRDLNVQTGKQGFQTREKPEPSLVRLEGLAPDRDRNPQDLTYEQAITHLESGGFVCIGTFDRDQQKTFYDYYDDASEFEEDWADARKSDDVNVCEAQRSANGTYSS